MTQVNMPAQRPKKNQMGQLLGIAGGVVGGIYGGPGGAAAGMSVGQGVGGMMGPQASAAPSPVQTSDATAMQRRMNAQSEDSLKVLRDSVGAIQSAPPELRQEYARPLYTAYVQEAKSRGINPFDPAHDPLAGSMGVG